MYLRGALTFGKKAAWAWRTSSAAMRSLSDAVWKAEACALAKRSASSSSRGEIGAACVDGEIPVIGATVGDEAAGVADGASGVADGAGGVADGAGGVADGAGGVADGAGGVADGVAGV